MSGASSRIAAQRARLRSRGGWIAAAVMVLVAFIMVGLIGDELAPAPQGPALSSYATTPDGVAAWAELLSRDGHQVSQLRAQLAGASLRPGSTLVVLGAQGASAAEVRTVQSFVRGGGWLVVGGGALSGALPKLLGPPQSALTVSTWSLGAGRIEAFTDPSAVENRLLAAGGNAELSLQLAGPADRAVVFDESIHGFGEATGLAALPDRWWVALAGLALAGLAWVLARGRRLGGADPRDPQVAAPRSAYVDAMALVLSKTRDVDTLAALARAAGERERNFERIRRS